jgi:hypothetical protein
MVIAEEYGEWEDCSRRIDILAIDRDAKLVVMELKRTPDGGHMELQAIRYAAMVSTMTFEQTVQIHEQYLIKNGRENTARESILSFLSWEEPDEEQFASDVRIILVAADFSKEITSAVLWLNKRELDITCIRIKPYKLDENVLLDIQQIIPLPEAEDFQIKIKEKDRLQRTKQNKIYTWKDFSEELEKNCSVEEARAVREVYEWLESRITKVFVGPTQYIPFFLVNDKKQWPFKVTSRGVIQVWFQYLANKPPFSDQALCLQLMDKLNEIPGVSISEDKIGGKPSLPVKLLTGKEEMQQFKDAFEWVFSEMESGDNR